MIFIAKALLVESNDVRARMSFVQYLLTRLLLGLSRRRLMNRLREREKSFVWKVRIWRIAAPYLTVRSHLKKKNSFMKDFSISQVFSHNSQPLSFCVITGLWISSKPPSGDKVNNPLKLLRCWIFQQSFLPSCLPHSLHWAYLFLQDEQALLSAYETLKAAYDL